MIIKSVLLILSTDTIRLDRSIKLHPYIEIYDAYICFSYFNTSRRLTFQSIHRLKGKFGSLTFLQFYAGCVALIKLNKREYWGEESIRNSTTKAII